MALHKTAPALRRVREQPRGYSLRRGRFRPGTPCPLLMHAGLTAYFTHIMPNVSTLPCCTSCVSPTPSFDLCISYLSSLPPSLRPGTILPAHSHSCLALSRFLSIHLHFFTSRLTLLCNCCLRRTCFPSLCLKCFSTHFSFPHLSFEPFSPSIL